MTEDLEKLLEKHDLKKTSARLSVLKYISSGKSAASQHDLEKHLGKDADRVTLYRILKTFEEKGLVHKIVDSNGTANYAACSAYCTEHQHHDEHIHFNCTVCNQVYCLDDMNIPKIEMPKGFKPETINMVVNGVCATCSAV